MKVTGYPDVDRLIEKLLARIHRDLGDKLVGFYLFGSTTTGDFDEGVSDVDLLAAIASELNDGEFESLRRMHDEVAHAKPDWDDRIEVLYLSVDALRTFRERRSPIAVISPGEPFHYREGGAGADWLMNWYHVRESGVRLFGPNAADLIPSITKSDFIDAVREHADRLLRWLREGSSNSALDQSYSVLTACRALYTATHGEHVSKRRAALWAMNELPEWSDLIEWALERRNQKRLGMRHATVDPEATFGDTLRLVEQIARRVSKSDNLIL